METASLILKDIKKKLREHDPRGLIIS